VADSVEEAVYSYLTSDSTFADKWESIDWLETKETAYPRLVFWQVTDAGTQTYIDRNRQGEARIQFDIWDSNKARGVRLRADTRAKVEDLNETISGITMHTDSLDEQTLQRDNTENPWHFVVDAVIIWHKE
jgi:predicted transcriptional regulator